MRLFNLIIGNRLFQADSSIGGPAAIDFDNLDNAGIEAELNKIDDLERQAPVQAPDKTDTPTTTDTEKLNEQIEQIENLEDKPKLEDTQVLNPPDPLPPTDTDKGHGPLVTDEFLNNLGLDADTLAYAQKFKDKPVAEFFKGYANAAKLIGKKKEELIPVTTQPVTTETKQPIQTQEPPETIAKAKEIKDNLILEKVVSTIPALKDNPPPNMDEDSPEYVEWERELQYNNPPLHRKFVKERENAEKLVDNVYSEYQDTQKNYGTKNEQIINGEVKAINDYFTNNLKIDPKTVGFDLTISPDGSNAILDGLLFKNGELDQNLVEFQFGKPIMKPGELSKKFFEQNFPDIITKVREQSRIEGINAANSKERPPRVPPSLAAAPGGRQQKELDSKSITNITDLKTIDQLLDEADKEDSV